LGTSPGALGAQTLSRGVSNAMSYRGKLVTAGIGKAAYRGGA
jgi:hypothetical protein